MFAGSEEGKWLSLRQMISDGLKPPVIIFVQSIERAKELYQELEGFNLRAQTIHADRSMEEREKIID